MSKADRNEQIDGDIPEREADMVRAHDTTPPYNKKTSQEPRPKATSAKTGPAGEAGGQNSAAREKADRKNTTEAKGESAKTQQQESEIPRFDLAKEIMAEQRKITAIRRKRPGERKQPENEEVKAEPAGYIVEQPVPAQSHEEKIIAEIVARDIERLCQKDNRQK